MGNAASGLPFVVGEEVGTYPESPETCSWRLHDGTKRSGGEQVSIFRLTLKTCPPIAREAAKAGMQSLRTLRHPHVLACLDSVQLDTEYVIATEKVMPLMQWMREHCEPRKKDDQVAWGMHCLCCALKFLHEDCKLYHNNISTDTVFVNSGGDWKLGGMDLLSPLGGKDYSIAQRRGLQPRAFQSAERNNDDWWRYTPSVDGAGVQMPIHCMDVFAMGRLLERVYPEGTPAALDKYVGKMLLPDPLKRPTASQYLRCAFLRRQSVKDLSALELFSVKTPEEKLELLRRFTPATHSKQALVHKVMPLLLRELAVASNTPPGAQAQGAARSAVSLCLPTLLEASNSLSKIVDDEHFHASVQPVLAGLFVVNDRGVRVMLLTSIPAYAKRLEDKVVNDQVFDPLCAGFTDAAAPLRELTLKSMVAFTGQLSEKNMNEKLIKHLARLQGDAEDSIRTNAIIFLGKVAAQLKPVVRDKVLLPAFARGVKDPFVATRLAGLRATAACHQHFKAEEVCTKVLPSVMPCLIDPGSEAVREAAFSCVETYLERLKEVSARMKVEEEERRRAEAAEKAAELAAHGAAGTGDGIAAGASVTSGAWAGSGGGAAEPSAPKRSSAGTEWGSWALSKLTERLSSSALPNGPVGDPSASGGGLSKSPPAFASPTTSPPPSVPRHHTTALGLNLNGSGKVSASIPGSVAAAVAAGLPIGGGGANTGRFGLQTAGGAGGGLGEEDEWQVGGWWRHCWGGGTTTTTTVATGAAVASNGAVKASSSLNLAAANAAAHDGGGGSGVGGGWDWDGLDVGDDGEASPDPPTRVASLSLRGVGQAGGGAREGAASARREAAAKRREARRVQRPEETTKTKPLVVKKLMDAPPPDGWEDF
ncbi:unnamed protein product [Ascophyllum nodosum]